ncbi:MAG: TonB-dependent hemoglobin/transferrin/lactoferrin family receptor [Acidobacteriota bacterium]
MTKLRPSPLPGYLYWVLAVLFFAIVLAPAVTAEEAANDDAETSQDAEAEDATFLDDITVTATLSERAIGDTPGHVNVVSSEEVEQRGYTGIDDLVRYLPGVEVDSDPTRLGTSGFTIRGIGGNRVLTEIDGIPTAEQFDFGPFSVNRFALDVDALESLEVVRSAGSALYGSDALGGVISLTTRTPGSYLGSESSFVGLRGGFDGRADQSSLSGVVAAGADRLRGSLLYTYRDGSELDNQGTIDAPNSTRTAPNPIDREQHNILGQFSYSNNDSSLWRGIVEVFDTDTETEVLSSIRGGSPFSAAVLESDGFDTQQRTRISLSHDYTGETALFDTASWRIFNQTTDTEQRTIEIREPSLGTALRDGLLTFDQETFGASAELQKVTGADSNAVWTYGFAFQRDQFDQLRDRTETVIATGAPVPTFLALPTKYFPQSDVDELGAFIQAELEFFDGRLALIPGVRFDRYDLDADQNDAIFLAGNPGSPTPVDFEEDAISPKLGFVLSLDSGFAVFGQYARGFRAPPMSAVNNGFTNLAGGYQTLPNPDLEPETSDNLELGLRGSFTKGSFSVTVFENSFEDFIETVGLGFNPAVFLFQFQPQNVTNVEISGVELDLEARLGRGFTLRGAFAVIEGDNEETDQPLSSLAPSQGVLGLRYLDQGGVWGAELIATHTEAKDAGDLPSGSTQFQTPSSNVLDLVGWWAMTTNLRLQLSAWNLGDETYWPWLQVRGQSQDSPTIDRFTAPGRSFGAQLRYTF